MADAGDLKSLLPNGGAGSSPASANKALSDISALFGIVRKRPEISGFHGLFCFLLRQSIPNLFGPYCPR